MSYSADARAVLDGCAARVPGGVRVRYRSSVWYMRVLNAIVIWAPLDRYWQGFGRTIYLPDGDAMPEDVTRKSELRGYEHEATHVLDSCTFFGLAPAWVPWWLCSLGFMAAYLFPWGVGRTWAELRAYRRSVELRGNRIPSHYVDAFVDSTYLWMAFPRSRAWVRNELTKPSAYGAVFDEWKRGG